MPSAIVDAIKASLLDGTSHSCAQFEENHFCVLRPQSAPFAPLLKELKHCFDTVARVPNQVEFLLSSGPVRLTKPGVFECDLHNDAHRSKLPLFSLMMEESLGPLVQLFKEHLPSLADLCDINNVADAKTHTTLKLQLNTGGSFPWHYDNPGVPNKRRLTMAVYLTEHWESCNGGEVLFQPFLKPEVSVSPQYVTVVLFRSDTALHAVRPFHASPACPARHCFTVWFDGASTNTDDDVNLRAKHLSMESLPLLQSTPLQRVLSRAVYDEEYRSRLAECFGGPNCRDARVAVAMHEAHLKPLLANSAVASFVAVLRKEKAQLLASTSAH
ncbi:2-oxoglutarate/Fe(II)-dependent oxygenase family protein, putative [Bodo saltans]|uniref:2-oxoglutarate/Fe(II)-dependent oxygenase family protein, putative n=1 Tax=Bodo saltans TaxID=75058 RepID=A0A0S4KJQ7_BODSA|nr:2-oxoglutarate/Fe(II)-dependent oxygenase family protein, putative [Bodo saltans]|eukprot:CUI14627.1 2-oxoglutarate/Fe(II)-dependent oxygenase family protein, putative [Bodo saltans]